MIDKKLYIVFGQSVSHFLGLSPNGLYIFKLFTEGREIEFEEIQNEFHLQSVQVHQDIFYGPFSDINALRRLAFEMGEFLEVEQAVLIEREAFDVHLQKCQHVSDLFQNLSSIGDPIPINQEQSSLWGKIFN